MLLPGQVAIWMGWQMPCYFSFGFPYSKCHDDLFGLTDILISKVERYAHFDVFFRIVRNMTFPFIGILQFWSGYITVLSRDIFALLDYSYTLDIELYLELPNLMVYEI